MELVFTASVRQAELRWLETWARGPVDVRSSRLPVQVGDRAPDLGLLGLDERWRSLADLWSVSPTVLVFLRPFGCPCATQRLVRMRDEVHLLRDREASVAVICQADPIRARAFFEPFAELEVLFLCDPHLAAYEAYGIREGTLVEVLFDRPDLRHARSRRIARELLAQARARGRPLVDNPWLLAGEFVVDAEGVIQLAYRYQHRCDVPDAGLILAAVEDLARSAPSRSPGGAEAEA